MYVEVIPVKTALEKDADSRLARSIFVPVAFVSMLTVATVGFSAYSHYSGQSRHHAPMPTSKISQDNLESLAMRVEIEQTRLNKLGKQMISKNNPQDTDFSLSWDNVISGKTHVAQTKQAPPRLSSKTFSPRPTIDVKRSIKVVSEKILQKYRYRRMGILPKGWPLRQGRVSSKYGWRGRRMHKGLDIAANTGTPVFAVEGGIVLRSKSVRGYGKLVELKHGDMYSSRYGHNSKLLVKAGDRIYKGQVIALVGSTGRSTGPHVHFEVRQSGVAINPIKYLGAMDSFSLAESLPLTKYVKVSKR